MIPISTDLLADNTRLFSVGLTTANVRSHKCSMKINRFAHGTLFLLINYHFAGKRIIKSMNA